MHKYCSNDCVEDCQITYATAGLQGSSAPVLCDCGLYFENCTDSARIIGSVNYWIDYYYCGGHGGCDYNTWLDGEDGGTASNVHEKDTWNSCGG